MKKKAPSRKRAAVKPKPNKKAKPAEKGALDLDKPAHARAYLLALEREGRLSFDEPDVTVSVLSDYECVLAARLCFFKFTEGDDSLLQ